MPINPVFITFHCTSNQKTSLETQCDMNTVTYYKYYVAFKGQPPLKIPLSVPNMFQVTTSEQYLNTS